MRNVVKVSEFVQLLYIEISECPTPHSYELESGTCGLLLKGSLILFYLPTLCISVISDMLPRFSSGVVAVYATHL